MLASKVRNGIKYLDETIPDWFDKIDLLSLNMINSEYCIAGQLDLPAYNIEKGMDLPVWRIREVPVHKRQRQWNVLQKLWETAIVSRRNR